MPLSINQIPIPVPSSTDPANFSARGDAVFGAFPDFITETNAVASEAAANRDSAETSKASAANSETNAATYAANATTSANNASSSSVASLWVSGTTYAINDKRVSPITGQVYRRKTAGAGTTDPSLDSTNWYAVLLDADTQYPSIKPTLNLDFANSGKLDPRITFTRASTATYYDGKTFAKAEENLLTYSQEFDNAVWVKTNATVTINSTTAPDGTTTTDTLLETATTTTHTAYQTVSVAAAQYFFSVYLKGAGRSFALVAVGANAVSVDLTLSTISAGNGTTADRAIQSVGGGWYRVSFSVTTTAGNNDFVIYTSTDGVWANRVYAGDIAKGLYLWGAQLEQRSSATAYTSTTSQPITKYQPVLKTANNNEPRFDYDPVTLESKGLLIEESRTNLLTYSEDFSPSSWGKTRVSISSNAVVAPDGTLTADRIVEDTATGSHAITAPTATISLASHTGSVYVKAAARSWCLISIGASAAGTAYFDLVNGAVGTITGGFTASITNVGNGWYRCSVSGSIAATAQSPFAVYPATANGTFSHTGDGFSGIYIWGAQLEAGSFPTSYIPTTTAAVTRQADSAVMTGANFSSWYRQDEGTIYTEATTSAPSANTPYVYDVSDGTTSNFISSLYAAIDHFDVKTGGTYQCTIDAGTVTQGVQAKVCGTYRVNDFAVCIGGGAVVADTSGVIPVVTNIRIGARSDGAANFNGTIKKITYYPKRLPNYQLQILTK